MPEELGGRRELASRCPDFLRREVDFDAARFQLLNHVATVVAHIGHHRGGCRGLASGELRFSEKMLLSYAVVLTMDLSHPTQVPLTSMSCHLAGNSPLHGTGLAVKLWVTSGAGAYRELPAWSAAILTVPVPVTVTRLRRIVAGPDTTL